MASLVLCIRPDATLNLFVVIYVYVNAYVYVYVQHTASCWQLRCWPAALAPHLLATLPFVTPNILRADHVLNAPHSKYQNLYNYT